MQPRKHRKPTQKGKKKRVDDCALIAFIQLLNNLILEPGSPIIGPSQFHNRTGQILLPAVNEMELELDPRVAASRRLLNFVCLPVRLHLV